MENKNGNFIKLLSSLFIAIAIIAGSYFISLGLRYDKIGNTFILDKWTKQIYTIDGNKYTKLK